MLPRLASTCYVAVADLLILLHLSASQVCRKAVYVVEISVCRNSLPQSTSGGGGVQWRTCQASPQEVDGG